MSAKDATPEGLNQHVTGSSPVGCGDGHTFILDWWDQADLRRIAQELKSKCAEQAATIARLEAERDAARLEAMEECAGILEALQQGSTLADMVTAIRAAMKAEPRALHD